MKLNRVPFLSPTFPDPEVVAAEYADIVASGMYTNDGPKARALADAMGRAVGGGTSVSLLANATVALQLACATTFHPDRPRVLVPSFTFAAAALAVRWCRYDVVFLDVDPRTWQPDLDAARSYLADEADHVAGIVLTQTFGTAEDRIGDWEKLAAHHALPLVIDSASGFGSVHSSGEPVGRRGACEVFSLHATKTFAIGEGGAIASRDPELIGRVDQLKNFGFDSSRSATVLGTNAKLSEFAAAIGLRQLDHLDDRISARQRSFRRYRHALEPLGMTFQPGGERSALAFVPAAVPDARERDALVNELGRHGIECRTYYNPPVHLQPLFATDLQVSPLQVTEDLARRMISFPLSDDLAGSVIDTIARITQYLLEAT